MRTPLSPWGTLRRSLSHLLLQMLHSTLQFSDLKMRKSVFLEKFHLLTATKNKQLYLLLNLWILLRILTVEMI